MKETAALYALLAFTSLRQKLSCVCLVVAFMPVPLSNASGIPTRKVGSVLQADLFEGGDASIRINACLAFARAAAGGTCDARMFTGNQRMSQTIEVLEKTVLLLPHSADWCWGFTDGVSVGIQQDSSSSVIGTATGGGGNNMLLSPCSRHTRMLALYATQNNPATGGQYIYASGFNAQNLVGASFTNGLVYTRYLFDESRLERISAINSSGDAWHILSTCCDTNFQEVQATSAYGPSGGTPLVVEGGAAFGWSGTINAAGTGHPNIEIRSGNYQIDFWDVYAETNGARADTATPVVSIAGTPVVRFYGGVVNMDSTKPCFNNPALVAVNNAWCTNNAVPREGVACPVNNTIFGTDNGHLYVCAGNRVRSLLLR